MFKFEQSGSIQLYEVVGKDFIFFYLA